jgi:fatty acid synthase
VHYAALNFRDVMLATGRLPADAIPGDLATQDCILGMEVSGLDEMGKRVMGLVPAKVSLIIFLFVLFIIAFQFTS